MAANEDLADISNWRNSPHSEWAFRNIGAVLPTALINKSSKPSELQRKLRSFDFQIDGKSLTELLRTTSTDSFVVVHQGQVIHEYYDHGNDATTPHILMSVTKSVTGLLIGKLSDQGVLDLAAPVTKYVPEVAAAYHGATIQQLADMRAGVVHDDNTHSSCGDRLATHWEPPAEGETQTNLHGYLRSLETESKPHGGPFAYVSVNTDLLGWVLERATGKTYAALVQELLWDPMGAVGDACVTVDSESSARAAGGLCATPIDFAKLGLAVMNDGVVAKEWVRDMVEGGDREAFQKGMFGGLFGKIFGGVVYRSGWYWIEESGCLMACGLYGQLLFVNLKNGLVVAKTSSQVQPVDVSAWGLDYKIVLEILKEFHE